MDVSSCAAHANERLPPAAGGWDAFGVVLSWLRAASAGAAGAHIGLTPGCFVNGCGLATAGVGAALVIGLTPGCGV